MSSSWLIGLSLLYLALLFAVAYWAENRLKVGKSLINNPYIYSLSLAIYCTAWTFYGSVGRAVSNGVEFLTVYIGPTLATPLWWIVLRKIIRICRVQRITTIADFISSRYGKSASLSVMVTVFCIMGIVPYISLQLKAISSSFIILSQVQHTGGFTTDITFYIATGLAVFIILFGTRTIEATERHDGLVMAVTVESVIKIIAFTAIGVFVTYGVYNGFADVFSRATQIPALQRHFSMNQTSSGTSTWFWHSLLSMLAIWFLPRQFQVAVVENVNERHLNTAMWLFPLYLFIINVFVLPVAFGGYMLFEGKGVKADDFVLSIPLLFNQNYLAFFVFLGGFSAATGMIIVETIALSIMISNNLVNPIAMGIPRVNAALGNNVGRFVKYTRRFSILGIVLLAYIYYHNISGNYSLVSIGLVSFTAVAQFAPLVLGGIFWKRATKAGAITGLMSGALLWFYTLIIPSLANAGVINSLILNEGLFGLYWLKPFNLFGMEYLDTISHGLFWSLFFNISSYVVVSMNTRQSSIEHNQAVLFVDIFKYSTIIESSTVWKGTAYIPDIRTLLHQFFGEIRTERVLKLFAQRHSLNLEHKHADPRLVNYAEKLLAGVIGTASARIMVSSVAKEEKIQMGEVVDILKASQELMIVNKELRRKSIQLERLTQQLKLANESLERSDKLKDDFLSTVAHEIRTPLTSIRALSEIVQDNPDLEQYQRVHFLGTITKETDRLSRLINQVLDLEKYESGKQRLYKETIDIGEVVRESVNSLTPLAKEKGIQIKLIIEKNLPFLQADQDKLVQVVVNLLSNAMKFCDNPKGEITITAVWLNEQAQVTVIDNGQGVPAEIQELIFEKFYQVENQTIRKPKGSGLGLAICKKIIDLHNGKIWVENNPKKGAKFTFTIP